MLFFSLAGLSGAAEKCHSINVLHIFTAKYEIGKYKKAVESGCNMAANWHASPWSNPLHYTETYQGQCCAEVLLPGSICIPKILFFSKPREEESNLIVFLYTAFTRWKGLSSCPFITETMHIDNALFWSTMVLNCPLISKLLFRYKWFAAIKWHIWLDQEHW